MREEVPKVDPNLKPEQSGFDFGLTNLETSNAAARDAFLSNKRNTVPNNPQRTELHDESVAKDLGMKN